MNSVEEIQKLMNQYCYCIDSGDFAGLGRLFEHAVWIAEGQQPSADSLSNIIIYSNGTPRTKHIYSNVTIEVSEKTYTAKGHSYVTVFQQTESFPLQPIFAGEYFDDFECVDGKWRFSRREIKNSLIGDMTAHLRNPSATIPGA